MSKNYPFIQRLIRPNWLIATGLSLLFLGAWVVNYVCIRNSMPQLDSRIFQLNLNTFWHILVILLTTILNLLIIAFINRKFTIIRVRTFLPIFIYALLISTWRVTHLAIQPHIASFFFLLAFVIFLNMYKGKHAVIPALWSGMAIAVASLLEPIYLFIIPIIWIGFIQHECLTLRTWLASLMGIALPWLFYVVYQVYIGNEILIFTDLRNGLFNWQDVMQLAAVDKVYLLSFTLIFVICLIGIFSNMLKDTLQTRKQINFHILFFFLILTVSVIGSFKNAALLPVLAYFLATLMAHPFSLKKSRFFAVLFVLFGLIQLAYFYLNCFVFGF